MSEKRDGNVSEEVRDSSLMSELAVSEIEKRVQIGKRCEENRDCIDRKLG